MEKYCLLGSLPGTQHQRFGIVRGGSIVSVQVSKPDGKEVPMDGLKYKIAGPVFDVRPEYINPQEYVFSTKASGEQARRPTWRRAGRKVAQ